MQDAPTARTRNPRHFNLTARLLHWVMAIAILAMLFIGVTMMSSLALRPVLIDLHQPLGSPSSAWHWCAWPIVYADRCRHCPRVFPAGKLQPRICRMACSTC